MTNERHSTILKETNVMRECDRDTGEREREREKEREMTYEMKGSRDRRLTPAAILGGRIPVLRRMNVIRI